VVAVFLGRRYECQRCGAVMTVVPCEVLPRILFGASAIALAIALYALGGQSAREVRAAVSPWRAEGATGWKSLHRWISRASALWRCVREPPDGWSTRQRAERVAATLAAHARPRPLSEDAAFLGAAHAR